jgi:hypothetical protein
MAYLLPSVEDHQDSTEGDKEKAQFNDSQHHGLIHQPTNQTTAKEIQ